MALTTYTDEELFGQTVADGVAASGTGDIFDKNWQTNTAIGLGVATGGVGIVLAANVMPVTTLALGTATGAFAYAGHRRSEGKDIFPWTVESKSDKKSDDKSDS